MVFIHASCDQKTFYVGITNDVTNRFKQHLNKESFFTKQFSDIKFVYAEKYKGQSEAAKREKQIKGWSKTKKNMLISGSSDYNTCTGRVGVLLADENLVSLLRANRRA